MSSPVVTSPLQYLAAITLLSPIVFAYAIAFISPSNRHQRVSIFLLLTAIAARLQYSIPHFTGNGTYDGLFMSLIWLFHLRAFDLLLWNTVYLGPARGSTLFRVFPAWCLLFNFRNINTSRPIKGLPAFSSSHPGYVPNKKEFSLKRAAHVLITYLLLDAIFAFLPAPNPENDVPEHKQPLFFRIGDVTLEEIIARPMTVLIPAFSIYGMFTIPYNIASLTAVLFCGSEPRNWPPLFGSWGEAHTLRQFWGISWHQIFRASLEASTSFLTTHVLCISPHYRTLSRYIRLHLAFLITAVIHLPGVVVLGGSPFATGVLKFFLMQAVGIMIESIVLNFWAGIKRTSVDDATPAGRMTKVLGYGWVLGWITWTGPSFTWLVARLLVQGRDEVVPWSLVKSLGYGK